MERGIKHMSKNNIISLNKKNNQQESIDVSLSYTVGKIRKIIDQYNVVDQISEITKVIKNLQLGENPYTKMVISYKECMFFRHQFNLMVKKLPTMVTIELIDILGSIWPKDAVVMDRLKMILIKSLETGMNMKQIQQIFFKDMDTCDYLLKGAIDFEKSILGDNIVEFPKNRWGK